LISRFLSFTTNIFAVYISDALADIDKLATLGKDIYTDNEIISIKW
jgi:hypothetical protein